MMNEEPSSPWRSLEQAARSPEYERWAQREFAPGASELLDGQSRRDFLKLMGASIALAGATACTKQPQEQILPLVRQPEETVPGMPLFYATAMTLGGFATGLLVESNEGRPTKIEGNPDHPFSLGATNMFHQAAILDLYDPDRSRAVRRAGEVSSYAEFLEEIVPVLAGLEQRGGAGLRVLAETVTSPTLAAQLDALLVKFPQAAVHHWEPVSRGNVHEGARLAFGQELEPDYDLSKARVIVSLDADFLSAHPASLRHARQFAAARRESVMNRLYVAEPTPTVTGSIADHRLPAAAREMVGLAAALAGHSAGSNPWAAAARVDLEAHRGEGLVMAGDDQPPAVHAAVHQLNDALGNTGRTVRYRARADRAGGSLAELVQAMQAGAVELLLILGTNPVYGAPADVPFAHALSRVKCAVQLAPGYDETSAHCRWHVPQAHFLETWTDSRAIDGAVTIGQPIIEPLYNGKSAVELMAALLGDPAPPTAYELHRAHWQKQHPGADFEKWWRKAVHDGLVAESALPLVQTNAPLAVSLAADAGDGLEIVFRPDPCVGDGRFANNGWLQELPKPVTKLTWDNAALLSPSLAAQLGVGNEDVVELTYRGRSVHAPVWITPGQAERSVTLHLGYGRTAAGSVGNGQGVNANLLRTSDAPGFGAGLQVRKVPKARWALATTQRHHNLEGRDHYRTSAHGEPAPAPDETLYPDDHPNKGYAWGMAIDLGACTGCNACVIACQAENNIPIVGKGEVIREREMHWIRVDSYFDGAPENPAIGNQPVPCMHCENAPCEIVCPVEATLHSPEGLNEQIYNRCIGTRYCSNNCPYKVRRFNFLQWADNDTLSFKLGRNPDVTVRSRGVMEKCTYCVQRINGAKIAAELENRGVRDGEIVTACQQSCPTKAIVFGDINDPNSRVSRLKRQPRNYGMLAELNTRPRTTYLANIRNPNPTLGGAKA